MFFLPFKINLRQLKAYWIAIIIFLSGILISFAVFRSYQEQAEQQAQVEFNRLADIRIFFIQNLCIEALEQLNYVKQFFDASPYVSKQDFHIFTQYFLKASSDLLGVGWYSINGADSQQEPNKVLLNFISTGVNLKPVEYHFFPLDYLELANSHYPFYIESREFDKFQEIFYQVETSPLLTLSGAIDFYQKNQKKGFLIFNPVSGEQNSHTSEDDRESIRGILIGFVNFESILQKPRTILEPIGLNIGIFDHTDDKETLLFWSPSILVEDKNIRVEQEGKEHWARSHTFPIGNREWTIRITPAEPFMEKYRKSKYWEIPLIGVLLSAFTSIYFLLLVNRHLLIENKVEARTKELGNTNRLLQQEIQERKKIEASSRKKQQYLQQRHEALEYLTKLTAIDPQNAVNEIIRRTASVMQIERTSLWLYKTENESPFLVCISLYNLSKNSFSNAPHFLSADYPHYFDLLNTHSHLIAPSENDLQMNQELDPYMAFYGIQSKLDIPIVFEGKLLGVLFCEETREQREWQLEDRHFGQTIAEVIAITIEQTARRAAEKALQVSEERLRFVMQKALDAVLSVTEQGNIISWNYGAESMFGYTESEIMYKPLALIFPIQIHPNEPSLKPIESKGKHKNGKIFPVEVSHTRWQSGTLFFDTIIVRDITKRKEYEQKLIQAINEAKAANQAKNEFLATISHELRTPLNAIIGFNQVLLMEIDGSINEAQKSNLQKIEKSSFHLLSLINDLLDLSKIEANKMELEIRLGNIAEVITACLEEISSLADQKGLELISSFEKELYLEMDSMRIRQVLLNLLSNAIKFTPAGQVKIEVINQRNTIEIQISDTGIGLSEEEIHKIFQPFMQADISIARRFGGTGLGLAISKKIIELHQGSITVKSEKNKGSLFIIILPKVQS